MISQRRIFRTVDGDLVDESDPSAAFLVVGAGCEVPDAWREKVAAFGAGQPEPASDDQDDEVLIADPTPKAVEPEVESKPKGRRARNATD